MLTTFGFLSPLEMGVILVLALIIFGPGKLPEVGKSLGRGISEFKSAANNDGILEKPESKEEQNTKAL